ncbi:hypothetical protein SAMD00019534_098080 [Acytostelium subglobosum LB1]|uniref:hypothetical protein n=1 Tax=Acytostelium subglobosum LB1 TaxID=1410327 RepID=UPI0006449597|nr:hypothetical protein SAMD00019534_098080 [Acytostelium subglobosum LB1]GAM26633.1 hypothetical protein SAMD00019534_098080 [Acytostelium subglobosum LB1]|eukprot:XP_012750294.1 hypothetical protein SAMD00019534_098080 [Acytostelium subglobosum LB1]
MEKSDEKQLKEWEKDYSNVDKTKKMVKTLKETQGIGEDNLNKLNEQSEQLNRINKLTEEQEELSKEMSKFKKFQKYLGFIGGASPTKKERDPKVEEIKSRYNKDENKLNNQQQHPIGATSQPGDDGAVWKNEADIKDNIYIQNAQWIKEEDKNLDDMNVLLGDLKNIAIATKNEVGRQGTKMDAINDSMVRGNDFNLKKDSTPDSRLKKEKDKKEKEQKSNSKALRS